MGPRPGGRGEGPADINTTAPPGVLQWGRDPEAAERLLAFSAKGSKARLQWGRDPEAAESRVERGVGLAQLPLQWGRDPEAAESGFETCDSGDGRSLQWGRDPEAAERIGGKYSRFDSWPASMGPRPGGRGEIVSPSQPPVDLKGFNGAATRRPRRAAEAGAASRGGSGASMGPRPGGRGEILREFGPDAIPELQWGRDPEAAESEGRRGRRRGKEGFNGAATRRPRRGGPS